ncbi:patatin-like phospholipase family protein, partial [Bradyrhizobium sp. STM 3809]|uniref:patatin-like phospholipase family protein n=1 Tax=Bradyrhizobium sp. STM 3809 TaxID=551936 RepID=UPI0005562BEA
MSAASPHQTPDQLAAHDLLSEMRTRIVTQPLPYQYGVEVSALESLRDIFRLAREAMKKYPGCREFARITTNMLNVDLRPVTAKWHRALEAGLLNSKDGANEFRADLKKLQVRLAEFTKKLQIMAYGEYVPDDATPDVLDKSEVASCFEPLKFGLDESWVSAGEINACEAGELNKRRSAAGLRVQDKIDAVGLALSGGGIRSATFCLGVVQVLAARRLMKHVDFLSTVSGGGYIGSFISAMIGSGDSFDAIGNPNGPDTTAISYVRQNARYLSVFELKQRLLMVTGTLAGLILNWMVPLFVVSILALG